MKLLLAVLTMCLAAITGYGQGKGVDQQNRRISEAGTARSPANNGRNQTVGAGQGIDFGGGRTANSTSIPNPYRFAVRRDTVIQAIEELMRERKLTLDIAASKVNEGLFVSQPYVFSKGVVVTQSDLNRYTDDLNATGARSWTRGRYVLTFEVQPVDAAITNLAVNAKIEGRVEEAFGAEWVTLRSNGVVEQQFLSEVVEKINGTTSAAPAK